METYVNLKNELAYETNFMDDREEEIDAIMEDETPEYLAGFRDFDEEEPEALDEEESLKNESKKVSPTHFKASHYQSDIFMEIKDGSGNLVVEAAAGSGKTTTILKSLTFIPKEKRVLIAAFNKAIVKDLQKKVDAKKENVTVKTIHGIGYSLLMMEKGISYIKVNEYKYRSYLYNHFARITGTETYAVSHGRMMQICSLIIRLCDLGRHCLVRSEEQLREVARRFQISAGDREFSSAMKLMEWGLDHQEEIDYTDMIWMPNALDLSHPEMMYDFVFIDECQDLNVAQRELVFRCIGESGRFIAVGDRNQAIYSFAGADMESFQKLIEVPNTKCMPLSISYRCAKQIVSLAQRFVTNIEANPANNTKGIILKDADLDKVEDDAMILCRNNAPLMEVYTNLLMAGKKCFVKGSDIGKNMLHLLNTSESNVLNADLRREGVFSDLYRDLVTMKKNIMSTVQISDSDAILSSQVQARFDMIRSLFILSHDCRYRKELEEKISNVFKDEGAGIVLSTVHKAKGLEAECVYILNPSLMPSPCAFKKWEREQEKNLMYVAYTRAKRKLAFLKEDHADKKHISVQQETVEQFHQIEERLRSLKSGTSRLSANKPTGASTFFIKTRSGKEIRF